MSRPSSKSWLHGAYFSLLTWMSPKHALHGLPVWTPLQSEEARPLMYQRVEQALTLLKTHSPERYRRVFRSLKGFLIFGTNTALGTYDSNNGVCRLGEKFVQAPETTPVAIASTLVHEATHGWLTDLGIPYDEPLRHRVELICIRASLLALRRVPDADKEREACHNELTADPSIYSNESVIQRRAEHLRKLGYPEWFVRFITWVGRRRAR